jgi:structural maintenance of chromosome 1
MRSIAVTLDGTVIHKSGLITGGRGGLDRKSERWEEKEIESKIYDSFHDVIMVRVILFGIFFTDLKSKKEQLIHELQEIVRLKKKFVDNDDLQSQISGIESRINYSKQDEVYSILSKMNCLIYSILCDLFRILLHPKSLVL